MRKIFILPLFWLLVCGLYAQTYRRHIFHNTPAFGCANEIYGLAGHFADTAKTVSVLGTGYLHGQYLNFVYTDAYATLTAKHYKTDNTPLVPKTLYRTATHTYVTAAFLRGSTCDYLLLKFLNDGTLLATKKVGEFPLHTIQAANILITALPGTTELLLCYHTIRDEGTALISEIHLYSVDGDLAPTGTVAKKMAFTLAESLDYNIIGNCDFYVADSVLHYNLLMDDALGKRFETGRMNLYTNQREARYMGGINAGSYDQRNRVLQVKNDTVYHLVNSCLAIYPPGNTPATYYPFDNSVFDCIELKETASGEWLGIFSDQVSTGAVGVFRPGLGNPVRLYGYSPMLPTQMLAHGDLFCVWGKHQSCALALDEFTAGSVEQCHPLLQTDALGRIMVQPDSSAVDVLPAAPPFSDVPLFEEANLFATTQALCNTYTAVYESEPLQVSVYPNPATDFVTVVSENAPVTRWRMTNMAGTTVLEKKPAEPESFQINLSDLPAGLYTLEIHTVKGSAFQKIAKP